MDHSVLTGKLRAFIEKFYYDDLLNAVKSKETSLVIDFSKLSMFDLDISELLLNDPDTVLGSAEEAIREFDLPDFDEDIRVRVVNLTKGQRIKIRNLRSKHLGKLICTDGLIRQASDIRPKVTLATFQCPGCGKELLVPQIDIKFTEPARCECGRKGKFKLKDQKLVDVQQLLIEESPESLVGGEQSKRLKVFLTEDLLTPKQDRRRYPGNKIKVVGMIKEVPIILRSGGRSTRYDLVLDANSVEIIEEEFEEVVISKEDEKIIKELANKPNIYEKLVKSVAPSIYGLDSIKMAIVLQLFGGVRKTHEDGTYTRGDIHVFLIGDPGAGKSQLLMYVHSLAPKSRLVSGRGVSAAGLVAAVVKDEFMGGWALEAGALVLANKGIALLDELDKISKEDTSAMHSAMEQQIAPISKANIQATLTTQTAILAAANPKFGRFDPYSPIPAQIDLPPTLINRFDLIFPVRDIPNAEKDELIARHVLELHKDSSLRNPEIDSTLFRKYIAYAKQKCSPKLTQGALDEIKDFYVNLRSTAALEESEVKSIPISARQLEALVRLAEASAKVRLSDKVTKKDAQRAIDLLRSCMEAVGTDPETGKFDIDRLTTGISATQRSRISVVRRVLDMLEARLGKNVPVADLLTEVENEGIERAKAEEILENLRKKGDIYEPKPGIIQRVG